MRRHCRPLLDRRSGAASVLSGATVPLSSVIVVAVGAKVLSMVRVSQDEEGRKCAGGSWCMVSAVSRAAQHPGIDHYRHQFPGSGR